MAGLDRNKWVRQVALPIAARFNPGDIVIRHHWTGDRVVLHSFRHRTYWYRGRQREQSTMNMLARLVRPDDTVLEAGGHIGYISLWLAHLASEGRCFVFEPSADNLQYLRMNTAGSPSITVVPQGLGAQPGELELHIDELTGQNSSFVEDFSGYRRSQRYAFTPTDSRSERVAITTIDAFVDEQGLSPKILKVDVEGFEAEVMLGARGTIERCRPIVMAEIHGYCAPDIDALLKPLGYSAMKEGGSPVADLSLASGNIFLIPEESDRLDRRPGVSANASAI